MAQDDRGTTYMRRLMPMIIRLICLILCLSLTPPLFAESIRGQPRLEYRELPSEGVEYYTLFLHPDEELAKDNSIDKFFGFIHVISTAAVVSKKSEENNQMVRISGCIRSGSSSTYTVRCNFEFAGQGHFGSYFDREQVIRNATRTMKNKSKVRRLLSEINVGARGLGFMEVEAIREEGQEVINKVSVNFSGRGTESPVKASLFEALFKDGAYIWRDREKVVTATIKSLTFRRHPPTLKPKMEIKLEYVGESKTLAAVTTAFIVNSFIIEPIEITEKGNDLMLAFGAALSQGQRFFTFR